MKVKTITTAETTTISDNVCPQNLVILVKEGDIERVRVNVAGVGYISDLTKNAIHALGTAQNVRDTESVSTEGKLYTIPLADGYHPSTRTEIEITTSGAAVDVKCYYNNTQEGSLFIKSERQVLFANQPAKFDDFAMLYLSDGNDFTEGGEDLELNVEYSNGVRHSGTVAEIIAMEMKNSGKVHRDDAVLIDNTEQIYKSIEFVPENDGIAVKVSYLIDKPEKLEKKLQKLRVQAERKQ